jgi:hypothetical protein
MSYIKRYADMHRDGPVRTEATFADVVVMKKVVGMAQIIRAPVAGTVSPQPAMTRNPNWL